MKTKYDWLEAVWRVVSYNFFGFVAFMILALFLFVLGCLAFTVLVKSFGFLSIALLAVVLSVVVLAGLTYREIKVRGWRYEKH